MITINIIPDDIKSEIKTKKVYVDIKRTVIFSSIFIVFYSASLVSGKILLDNHFSDLNSQTLNVTKNTQKFTNSADEINKELDEAEQIQAKNIRWSDFLLSMSKKTGEGIRLSHLSVGSGGTLLMRGSSASREALLSFKVELEKTPYLSDISLPLKNLLEKSDSDFELTAKISKYEFTEVQQ